MTLKELYSIPYLEKEIKDYQEKIQQLEEMALGCTTKFTGMPRGGGTGDKVGEAATAIAFYENLLLGAIVKKITTETEITKFIEGVDDAELRRIMHLRFIKQRTWQDVAMEVGGGNTEDGVRKRCNRFVKKSGGTSDMSANKVIY